MAREFIYIGAEGWPDKTVVRGYAFKIGGDPVQVTDDALANNLANNPGFEEIGGEPKAEKPAEPADQSEYIRKLECFVADVSDRAGLEGKGTMVEILEALDVALVGFDNADGDQEEEEQADYEAAEPDVDAMDATIAEIKAHEDWSAEHHKTRIKWANALSEGQVKTADEADQIIFDRLVEHEQDT